VPIRHTLLEVASRIPAPQGMLRRIVDTGCVVFYSHAVVVDRPAPHLEWLVPCKTATRFEADLTWLLRRYRFVGYDDVEASLTGTCSLPKNAALLTFDDGYAELHSVVWPLLRRLDIPALAFLTTSLVDNTALSADCKASLCVSTFLRLDRADQSAVVKELGLPDFVDMRSLDTGRELREYLRSNDAVAQALWHRLALDEAGYLRGTAPYLTREQVREMVADGWSFGGHATVHRRLQGLSRHELEWEIAHSCDTAAELSGRARAPLAFPYSGEGLRRDWLAEIRDRNSRVGLFFDVYGLRREGSLIWHRVSIEDPNESIGTTMRRAYLLALRRR
jgi:peptidoglycan/xylan/chitin deacetylase (PgdA/CDA1 family)